MPSCGGRGKAAVGRAGNQHICGIPKRKVCAAYLQRLAIDNQAAVKLRLQEVKHTTCLLRCLDYRPETSQPLTITSETVNVAYASPPGVYTVLSPPAYSTWRYK